MNQIIEEHTKFADRKILWLVVGVIVVKLLLLPFAQTVDADAVSRTFISEDWLRHPAWIINCVWGPFHFYLTGIILAIWNNTVYAPVVLNILLSAITLIPFYHFVKREFNSYGAFVSSCFLAISPIIFRNSMMNMSETPYLLLLVLTLNLLSKGFKTRTSVDFILAGICATLGSGFRFESWLFIPLLTFIILEKKEKINAVLFFIFALIYPVSDMLTHFLSDHYTFSGFFNNYPWNLHPNGYFAPPNVEDYLRRLWFIPFCWFISMGPLAFISIREILLARKRNADFFGGAVLFWTLLFLTEISAVKGAIILHERFSATITLLSLPFIANYYQNLTSGKIRWALVFGVITTGLTFIYNISNISPLPRLTDQNGNKVAEIIGKNISPRSGLVIDFWEWENTYYLGLQSKLLPENICLLSGDDKEKISSDKIDSILFNHQQGIILLVKNSFLWKNTVVINNRLRFKFDSIPLNVKEIYNSDAVLVWKYNSIR